MGDYLRLYDRRGRIVRAIGVGAERLTTLSTRAGPLLICAGPDGAVTALAEQAAR